LRLRLHCRGLIHLHRLLLLLLLLRLLRLLRRLLCRLLLRLLRRLLVNVCGSWACSLLALKLSGRRFLFFNKRTRIRGHAIPRIQRLQRLQLPPRRRLPTPLAPVCCCHSILLHRCRAGGGGGSSARGCGCGCGRRDVERDAGLCAHEAAAADGCLDV